MVKIIVNANVEVHMVPRKNDTYTLCYPGGNELVILPKEALREIVSQFVDIWNDLINQKREEISVYCSGPQITSRRTQADEFVTSPRVLSIQNDQFEVIFGIGAVEVLLCLIKIIWNQEQNDSGDLVPYNISTEKHILIDIHRNTFSLVNETKPHMEGNPTRVSFPLHVLAYLWSCFPSIISDFRDTALSETYWADEVKMIWWDSGECNILIFQNEDDEDEEDGPRVAIRESSFRNMIAHAAGVADLPDEIRVLSLKHPLSVGKSIDFSADCQYFRTLNNRYELDTLPTSALDVLWEKREDITMHFRTGSGGGVEDEGTTYWNNDDYTIQAGLFINENRGINHCVLRFNRLKDIILKDKWFFVITEAVFNKLFDLYQQERKQGKLN